MTERKCVICGKAFILKDRQGAKITCSKKCSIIRHRDKMREYMKRVYREDPKVRKYLCNANIKYRKELRKKVVLHYGGSPPKCACCGESYYGFLTIDHVHGNGKKHRKKIHNDRQLCIWIIKNNFPEGFQILCHNCNWLKKDVDKPFCKAHHPELY